MIRFFLNDSSTQLEYTLSRMAIYTQFKTTETSWKVPSDATMEDLQVHEVFYMSKNKVFYKGEELQSTCTVSEKREYALEQADIEAESGIDEEDEALKEISALIDATLDTNLEKTHRLLTEIQKLCEQKKYDALLHQMMRNDPN